MTPGAPNVNHQQTLRETITINNELTAQPLAAEGNGGLNYFTCQIVALDPAFVKQNTVIFSSFGCFLPYAGYHHRETIRG